MDGTLPAERADPALASNARARDVSSFATAERNVSVVSGKSFYLTESLERDRFLRISVSRARAEQIDEGVAAIAEEIRKGSGNEPRL